MNSSLQDKALAKAEALVPLLGDRSVDEPMRPIEADSSRRRLEAVKAKRAAPRA